jgi:hypothetical protein
MRNSKNVQTLQQTESFHVELCNLSLNRGPGIFASSGTTKLKVVEHPTGIMYIRCARGYVEA